MQDYLLHFKNWFEIKVKLWQHDSKIIFKERELWWCSVGINIGEEIYGKGEKFTRPVLIFKKFTSNSFMALPLTTQNKTGSWYVSIIHAGKTSSIILNQARIMDRKRLTNRIGTLDDADFKRVKQGFLKFYGS